MNPDNNRKYVRIKLSTLLIAVLVLAAGLFGWWLGRPDTSTNSRPSSQTESTVLNDDAPGVKSLISYRLPDGWKEAGCEAAPGSVFITPAGAPAVDCEANPSSPVKISVDTGNKKDCNQLQNVQDVKKHVCISLYINNHRSLKASTEYLESSSYGRATTINAYYIDIGEAVIKVEYQFNSDNQYQAGFDELANSVKAK